MDDHVSTETHGDLRIPNFKKLYIYIDIPNSLLGDMKNIPTFSKPANH